MSPHADTHDLPKGERSNPLTLVVSVALVVAAVAFILLSFFEGEIGSQSFLLFAGMAAAIVYVLTMIDIRIGIACLFLAIGVSPELEFAGISNIRLEDFLVPVLTIAWLTRHMQNREEFVSTPLRGPIIAFLTFAAISALFGTMTGEIQVRRSFLVLGKTSIYFLLFLIVINNTRSLQEFKAYTILVILVTVISCLHSLQSPISPGVPGAERLQGPYGESANIYAGYLAMNLAVMFGLFVYLPSAAGRLALSIAGLTVLYGMLLTLSRTTYVALAVALVGFGLLKARRIAALFLAAVLLVGIVTPQHVIGRAATLLQIPTGDQPESLRARVRAWEGAQTKFEESPIIGHGLSYIPFGWVDNEYVRVALDMGLLGLAAFFWLLFAMARMALWTFNAAPEDPMARGYAAGYCMALICMSIHAWGATSFASIRTMEAFMVITGLAGALFANLENWGLVRPGQSETADTIAKPAPAVF